MPDKGLFVIVAMSGFSVIVAAKLSGLGATTIALIASGLMLLYGIIAYRIHEVRLRLDRLGDNFYYLGFLFTLASLSAALLQLQQGFDIQQLLGSFGVALFTTIVGISGRVMFAQMRGELDDVEEAVRRELVSTAERLRGELGTTLREFQTLHTAIVQLSSEAVGRTKAAMDEQVIVVGQAANAIAAGIQKSFKGQADQAKEIGQALQRTGQALAVLSERVSTMELPGERLAGQLDRIGAELDAIAKGFRAAREEAERWRVGRRWWRIPFLR